MELNIDGCIALGTTAVRRAIKDYVMCGIRLAALELYDAGCRTKEVKEQIALINAKAERCIGYGRRSKHISREDRIIATAGYKIQLVKWYKEEMESCRQMFMQ